LWIGDEFEAEFSARCGRGQWRADEVERRQRLTVALAGHEGARNLLSRFADDVRAHVGQRELHLRPRLLQVLNMTPGLRSNLSRYRDSARRAQTLARSHQPSSSVH